MIWSPKLPGSQMFRMLRDASAGWGKWREMNLSSPPKKGEGACKHSFALTTRVRPGQTLLLEGCTWCCRMLPLRKKPEDGSQQLAYGPSQPSSHSRAGQISQKSRLTGCWQYSTKLQAQGLLKATVRRDFPSCAWLRHVWRNTVWGFDFSLRPRSWTMAKGRFPDLSDQLFPRT